MPHVFQSRMWTLRILWGALLSSLAIYAGLTFILKPPDGFVADPQLISLLTTVLAGLGALILVAIPIVRRSMFWWPLELGHITLYQFFPHFQTVSLVSWAMCEAVAVFGFILYFLSYQQLPALAIMGAAALTMISLAPVKIPKHPEGSW